MIGGSPVTVIVIFGISGSMLVGLVVPIVPTFGTNVPTKLAIDEECVGVRTPWAAQINLVYAFIGR